MNMSRIFAVACALSLSTPAIAQDVDCSLPEYKKHEECDCSLPENAEREECLGLLPFDDITNFLPIAAGGAGLLILGAAAGGGSSGTTGTTGTSN